MGREGHWTMAPRPGPVATFSHGPRPSSEGRGRKARPRHLRLVRLTMASLAFSFLCVQSLQKSALLFK